MKMKLHQILKPRLALFFSFYLKIQQSEPNFLEIQKTSLKTGPEVPYIYNF
jgi:hypothetical protein